MSDSIPPDDEGPDPYEGQDLDGLLSGSAGSFPEELRPVAAVLNTLRTAPADADLDGEAAVRAEFRKVMLGGGASAWPSNDDAESRTLVLPAGASSDPPHIVTGRHRRQRPARRGRWQAKALVGVAAAAVVVVGVSAFAGTFSGADRGTAPPGRSPSTASTTVKSTASGSNGLAGEHATQEPSLKPTPTASPQPTSDPAAESSELCHEYYDPEQPLDPYDRYWLFQQLSDLAGGPMSVYHYCVQFEPGHYSGFPPPGDPQDAQYPGAQGEGGQDSHDGNRSPAGEHGNSGANGNSKNDNGR